MLFPLSFVILLSLLLPSPDHSPESSLGSPHPPFSHFGEGQHLCTHSLASCADAPAPTEANQGHSGLGSVPQVGLCFLPGPLFLVVC